MELRIDSRFAAAFAFQSMMTIVISGPITAAVSQRIASPDPAISVVSESTRSISRQSALNAPPTRTSIKREL
jgi:hypothetical protein